MRSGVLSVARPAALDKGDWKGLADAWLEERAARPDSFTADDLRVAVLDCPSSKLPGVVFSSAAKRRLIVEVAVQRSRTSSRKGSRIGVWEGVAA